MGSFKNLMEVITSIDIDCTAMMYDGQKLWAIERTRFTRNTKINVVDTRLYAIRGAPNYEK